MNDERDTKLDRLLSGGGLSVQEREDALQGALAAAGHDDAGRGAPRGAFARLRAAILVPGLTALAAAAAFIVLARDAPLEAPSAFTSRGDARAQAAPVATWLKVACAQPLPTGACPRSSTLRLGVEPAPGQRALAVAMLDADGVLSWSFPDETGRSATLSETSFVALEIALGPQTPPGIHRVFALRSVAPMARGTVRRMIEEALAGGRAARDPDLVVARVEIAP